jgi:hypothetical protein
LLIEAETDEQALQEANRIGKSYYDDTENPNEEGLTWEGRPAYWVFAGVRKLIIVTETAGSVMEKREPWSRPDHGTEITYSQMEVEREEALLKLVNGDPVQVLYEE